MDIILTRRRRMATGFSSGIYSGIFSDLIDQMIAAKNDALDIKTAIAAT